MHLPDGFLNNQMSVGLLAVAIGFLAAVFRQIKKSLFEKVALTKSRLALADGPVAESSAVERLALTRKGVKKSQLMAVLGALIFAMQMMNFPVANGTSGHLIGGVLLAVVLGPWLGLAAISIVLIVQSLIFADGGVLALGANIFNMGIIATSGGYYVYKLIISKVGRSVRFLTIGLAAWLSIMAAAFFCALEIGLSGTISLALVILAMVKIHSLIGIGEALLTIAIIKSLKLKLYEE